MHSEQHNSLRLGFSSDNQNEFASNELIQEVHFDSRISMGIRWDPEDPFKTPSKSVKNDESVIDLEEKPEEFEPNPIIRLKNKWNSGSRLSMGDIMISSPLKNKNALESKTNKDGSLLIKMPSVSFSAEIIRNTLLIQKLKSFISNLRWKTYYRKISASNHKITHAIDDKSYYNKGIQDLKAYKILNYLAKKALKFTFIGKINIPTLNPLGPIFSLFNPFFLIMIFFYLVYIPLNISLGIFIGQEFTLLFISLILLSCFMNINSGVIENGQLVMDKTITLKKQFQKNFGKYLLILIPLFATLTSKFDEHEIFSSSLIWKLLFIFALPLFFENLNTFEDHLRLHGRKKVIYDMYMLLFYCLYMCHFFCCGYIVVSRISETYYKETWILKLEPNINQPSLYLHSLYWAIVTTMTVGYGDITPINDFEIIFAVITILFGGALFLYNINYLGILLSELTKEQKMLKQNLYIIDMFMERKNINSDLQKRIRHYLSHPANSESLVNEEQEKLVIEKLSKALKNEILFTTKGSVIKDIPFLYNNFSTATLTKLVYVMKEKRFSPEEVLFIENDVGEEKLYFVEKGEIELFKINFENKNTKNYRILNKGETIGEASFFSNAKKLFSARSRGFSEVLMIYKADFMKIIKENNEDFEKYCNIRDSINISENLFYLDVRCNACNAKGHYSQNCPSTHYIPDKEKIIMSYNFGHNQERKTMIRSFSRKFRSMKYRKIVLKDVTKLYDENNFIEEKIKSNILFLFRFSNIYDNDDKLLEKSLSRLISRVDQSIKSSLNDHNEQRDSIHSQRQIEQEKFEYSESLCEENDINELNIGESNFEVKQKIKFQLHSNQETILVQEQSSCSKKGLIDEEFQLTKKVELEIDKAKNFDNYSIGFNPSWRIGKGKRIRLNRKDKISKYLLFPRNIKNTQNSQNTSPKGRGGSIKNRLRASILNNFLSKNYIFTRHNDKKTSTFLELVTDLIQKRRENEHKEKNKEFRT